MNEGTTIPAAERAKLEQRRDRLMQLMKEPQDAEDRADLEREWRKIDDQLNRSR